MPVEAVRPLEWLRRYEERYPGAFRAIDRMALARRWPTYVYAPLEAAFAVLFAGEPGPPSPDDPRIRDAAPLVGLAGWRLGKGVYRFAPELFDELWQAPFEGVIPVEPLRHLPEYTLYVETPGQTMEGVPLRGFFAFLTTDLTERNDELYLLWDLESAPGFHTVLHLEGTTVEEALEAAALEGTRRLTPEDRARLEGVLGERGASLEEAVRASVALNLDYVRRALSLLFFIAATDDFRGPEPRPRRPRPQKTRRRGTVWFPAPGVRTWDVGVRYAAALRRAYARAAGGEGAGTGSRKRPHVRRAHWHGYWVGPRKDPKRRRLELRWLPPILVGVRGEEVLPEDLPVVVWRVRA